MTLADQIIEYGPIAQDYLIGPGFAGPLRWLCAADVNALRDELLELRRLRAAAEARERFYVEGGGQHSEGLGIWLTHDCGRILHEPFRSDLAELCQRADEHGKECR